MAFRFEHNCISLQPLTVFGKKNAVILSAEFCYLFQGREKKKKQNIKGTICAKAKRGKGSTEIGILLRISSYAYVSICVLLEISGFMIPKYYD